MVKVTELEKSAIEAFRNESLDCCGAFDDQENMSYMNADDLARSLQISKHAAAGLLGSLEKKNLISDCGESARGAKCNDYTGNEKLINPILDAK